MLWCLFLTVLTLKLCHRMSRLPYSIFTVSTDLTLPFHLINLLLLCSFNNIIIVWNSSSHTDFSLSLKWHNIKDPLWFCYFMTPLAYTRLLAVLTGPVPLVKHSSEPLCVLEHSTGQEDISCPIIKYLTAAARLTKARYWVHFNLQFPWIWCIDHGVFPELTLPKHAIHSISNYCSLRSYVWSWLGRHCASSWCN